MKPGDSGNNTLWIVGGVVATIGVVLFYFRDKIFGSKKSNSGLNATSQFDLSLLDDQFKADRLAEIMSNITLPSSLPLNFSVKSAVISGFAHGVLSVKIKHVYNAGYVIGVDHDRTKIVRDKEGGWPTNWGCIDWEHCSVKGFFSYYPVIRNHSQSGGGLSENDIAQHGKTIETTLAFPLCTKHCKDDNTYAGEISLIYFDPDSPDVGIVISQANGAPHKFAYGEEANDGDCTNMNSNWRRTARLCLD